MTSKIFSKLVVSILVSGIVLIPSVANAETTSTYSHNYGIHLSKDDPDVWEFKEGALSDEEIFLDKFAEEHLQGYWKDDNYPNKTFYFGPHIWGSNLGSRIIDDLDSSNDVHFSNPGMVRTAFITDDTPNRGTLIAKFVMGSNSEDVYSNGDGLIQFLDSNSVIMEVQHYGSHLGIERQVDETWNLHKISDLSPEQVVFSDSQFDGYKNQYVEIFEAPIPDEPEPLPGIWRFEESHFSELLLLHADSEKHTSNGAWNYSDFPLETEKQSDSNVDFDSIVQRNSHFGTITFIFSLIVAGIFAILVIKEIKKTEFKKVEKEKEFIALAKSVFEEQEVDEFSTNNSVSYSEDFWNSDSNKDWLKDSDDFSSEDGWWNKDI